MGHIRLGRLPTSRRWNQVIGLLEHGGSVPELAAATAHAAESELQSAKGDPALGAAVWLLTQLPRAARSQRFAHELAALGFDPGAEQSLFSLTASFSNAVDRNGAAQKTRTDLGELAVQAANESLTAIVSAQTPSLFDSTAEDLQRALGQLTTKDRFASLARDFFARLTLKTLEYYISRELPNHVGSGGSYATTQHHIDFYAALERHCREAALIVEQFAGGWYSKSQFRGTLTPDSAQAFTDYALKKVRDELHARASADA